MRFKTKASIAVLMGMLFQAGNGMQMYADGISNGTARMSIAEEQSDNDKNQAEISTKDKSIVLSEDRGKTIHVRLNNKPRMIEKTVEFRLNDFEFNGDKANIQFNKGWKVGRMFLDQGSFEKEYVYEKIFKGLEKRDENHYVAKYDIFADTEEVGRIQLEENFVDEQNLLKPYKSVIKAENKDDELVSIGDVNTYVTVDGKDHVINNYQGIRVPYILERTEMDEAFEAAPDGGDNVNVYTRWNGEEVRRNWEGKELKKNTVNPTNSSGRTGIRKEQVFAGLKKVDDKHSYVIYEIFANTPDEKIRLTNNFVDQEELLEHQEKDNRVENKDNELVTVKDIETYVIVNGEKHVVREEKGVRVPYILERTEMDEAFEEAPDGGDNVNVYTRWNGEEVRRNWEGKELKRKSTVNPTNSSGQTGIQKEKVAEKGVRVPNELVKTEKYGKYKGAATEEDNENIHVRWNGDEVKRNWEERVLREKPAPEPPVTPPASQKISFSFSTFNWYGMWSGIFTWIKHVLIAVQRGIF